jgi:hypothetical protein
VTQSLLPMLPSRRPTILSHWKQLTLIRPASLHGSTLPTTRVPPFGEIKHPCSQLTVKEDTARRGYAMETRGTKQSGPHQFCQGTIRQTRHPHFDKILIANRYIFLFTPLKNNADSPPFTEAKLPVALLGLQGNSESRLSQCIARQTKIHSM